MYLHFCHLIVSKKDLCSQFIQRGIVQFFLVNLKETTLELKNKGPALSPSIKDLQDLSSRILVKLFSNSNVTLFRFEDLAEYVTIYHKNIEFLVNREEIEIFEFQLSMVNIVGHHPSLSSSIVSRELVLFIYNNMCTDNRFLQTSSIELLNNLLIDNPSLVSELTSPLTHVHLVKHLCFFYSYVLQELSLDSDPNPYTRRTRQLTILTYILTQIQENPLLRKDNPLKAVTTAWLTQHLREETLEFALGLKQYLG